MINKAIIPAAGYGTRLLPITKIIPKALMPILSKPLIHYIIEELINAGINEILVIIGWKGQLIREFYEYEENELTRWLKDRGKHNLIEELRRIIPRNVKISYKIQDVLDGLAGAVLRGAFFTEKNDFVVALGDNIIIEKDSGELLSEMIKVHKNLQSALTLCVSKVPEEWIPRFGIIDFGEEMKLNNIRVYRVSKLVEKPRIEEAPSNLAIVGRYIFSSRVLDYLKKAPIIGGEISETDAFQDMINDGLNVYAVDMGNRKWYDVGSPEGYAKAFIELTLIDHIIGANIREWLKEIL